MLKRSQLCSINSMIHKKYDVLVAGAGPAGFGAALAAARLGASTMLVEARGFPGGVASTSLWMPINRLKKNGGTRGGVHAMLVERLEKYGPNAYRDGKVTWTDGDGLHVHPEYLQLAMYELLEEAGCHYRMHSPVTGAQVIDGVVRSVDITTRGISQRISADIFIDCTGDGTLSYLAGADFRVGRDHDGATMPVTLGFALANTDSERLFSFYDSPNSQQDMDSYIESARKNGYTVSTWYSFDRTTIPGVISVNNGGIMGHDGAINALDSSDRTFGERAGLQIAVDFVQLAHELRIPGLENCSLVRAGAEIGVRETRRIMCDYVLTIEDAEEGREFDDVIARRYGAVDQAGLNASESDQKIVMHSGHAFPYRAILVKGIENLLVAGRCGSFTHMALAAGKSMGNMMAIGQAAGIAAAITSRSKTLLRELQYQDISDTFNQLNVIL